MLLTNTVSARQLQREYKKIFEKVNRTKEPVIVISDNKPQGAIVDLETFEQLERKKALLALEEVRSKNSDKSPDEIYRIVTDIVKEVRQENYEKDKKSRR